MKYLSKFNDANIFLIQEDIGDALDFIGLYLKLEDFINDYKLYLSKKLNTDKKNIPHRLVKGEEGDVDEIHIEKGAEYHVFTYELVELNKIYTQ